MDDRVVWTLGATADFQEVYSQLDEASGDALVERVEAALQLVLLFPRQAPVYFRRHRRLLIGARRRYGLFYSVEGGRIIVSAVADLRQDPDRIIEMRSRRVGG